MSRFGWQKASFLVIRNERENSMHVSYTPDSYITLNKKYKVVPERWYLKVHENDVEEQCIATFYHGVIELEIANVLISHEEHEIDGEAYEIFTVSEIDADTDSEYFMFFVLGPSNLHKVEINNEKTGVHYGTKFTYRGFPPELVDKLDISIRNILGEPSPVDYSKVIEMPQDAWAYVNEDRFLRYIGPIGKGYACVSMSTIHGSEL